MNTMIAYHGTNVEAARFIIRTGFREGTYFAYGKGAEQAAVKFGGPYVFSVRFDLDPKHWKGESDGWQFWLRDPINPEKIIALKFMRWRWVWEGLLCRDYYREGDDSSMSYQ